LFDSSLISTGLETLAEALLLLEEFPELAGGGGGAMIFGGI